MVRQANVRQGMNREARTSIDETIQSEERAFSERLHEQARNDTPLQDDIENLT